MSINRVSLPGASPRGAQGPHAQVQSSTLKALWNGGFSKGQGSVVYLLANSNVARVCTINSPDQFLPHFSLLTHDCLPVDMLLLFHAVLFELLINYEKRLSSELLLSHVSLPAHCKQQQSRVEIAMILCP